MLSRPRPAHAHWWSVAGGIGCRRKRAHRRCRASRGVSGGRVLLQERTRRGSRLRSLRTLVSWWCGHNGQAAVLAQAFA
eukprot:6087840-Pyramimonas_sp.AAC.1